MPLNVRENSRLKIILGQDFPKPIKLDKIDRVEGDFDWAAARNCVKFYLLNKRLNLNPPKYRAFQNFLDLSKEQARKTNVWRWYFQTGGHPPYDPNKHY